VKEEEAEQMFGMDRLEIKNLHDAEVKRTVPG
jgi:hypothetical protein